MTRRPAPPVRRSRLPLLPLLVLVVTGLLAACSSPTDDARPRIVVTTAILGDLVQRVVGDAARVDTLMPPGADPHDYEASAAQAASMRDAALVVENGLGLESRLQPAIDAAAKDGVPVLALGDRLDPLPLDAAMADIGHDHGATETNDDSHDHAHEEAGTPTAAPGSETETDDAVVDPHVWLDPDRMARAAMIVADEVARIIGADDATTATLRANAERYGAEARAAAADATATLSVVPPARRLLITNHDALGYFAERFDLRIAGVIVPGGSTLAEPSAADLAQLVDVLRDNDLRTIFTESTTSTRLPDALAREAGGDVRVVELTTDTLGAGGAADATYAGLIRELANRIAEGLRSP